MHIAMVAPSFPPFTGGLEGHVAGLTAGLRRQQVEVTLVTQGARTEDYRTSEGAQVLSFRSWTGTGTYRIAPGVAAWVGRHAGEFDLLHMHSFHGACAPMVTLANRSTPVVFTPHFHGGGHTRFARMLHRWYGALGARTLREAKVLIAVSEAEADLLRARHTRLPPIKVIPNAPGSDLIGEAAPFTSDVPTILSVGRLAGYKNTRLLTEAMAELPWARLVIIGGGPEQPFLESRAAKVANVEVLGALPRPVVDRWLRTADVVASLSDHEAFGMSMLEGLAGGARVLASDIPSHREVTVLAGCTDRVALLPLPTGVAGVAQSLRQLLSQGRPETPAAAWNWDDVAAQTIDVYKRTSGCASFDTVKAF